MGRKFHHHNSQNQVQKGKTQRNPIPNGINTIGKFQTCKKKASNINN